MTKKQKANRLIQEKSPYLLQHAYNPVDWYPWGEDAFQKAKNENKPVFVSIGYSTCHWCHVMEKESFEDEEVARLLNDRFISIKVDREERPDLDSIYMKACQMLTGQGGWPLNVFLTPDKKPFYAGTFFPKESRFGLPGFKELIVKLFDLYQKDRGKIDKIAEEMTSLLQKNASYQEKQPLNEAVLHHAYQLLSTMFDETYGGFSQSPKFPIPHELMFLLKYYYWTTEKHALTMATKTLEQMYKGGIYDHIGGGFHRYAVDEKWLVPHFEKMLYDNALLMYVYSEAYQLTNNNLFQQIVDEMFSFINREMTSSEGAFYSALDADSEGEEGKYYLWEKKEIIDWLGGELGAIFCHAYGITDEGNFHGKNIPNLIDVNFEQLAEKHHLTKELLEEKLHQAKKELLKKRAERSYPHLDDKILTAWNALMIAGLAKAYQTFHEEKYLLAAEKAIQFLEKHLFINGRWMARFRDGEVKYEGYLDDYAYLLWAYIELYEATFNPMYLKSAKEVAMQMIDLFHAETGGFYFTASNHEHVIVRELQMYDDALPSGNSIASFNLLKLAHLTGELKFRELAENLLTLIAKECRENPLAFTFFLQTFLLMKKGLKEIVIYSNRNDEKTLELVQKLQSSFLPDYSVIYVKEDKNLKEVATFIENFPHHESFAFYHCENFSCNQPLFSHEEVYKRYENELSKKF